MEEVIAIIASTLFAIYIFYSLLPSRSSGPVEKQKSNPASQPKQEPISQPEPYIPCKFTDGITAVEFYKLAYKTAKSIKRVKKCTIRGAKVNCTVIAQSGIYEWEFWLDFNDHGHLTGRYSMYSGNYDSGIPEVIGNRISNSLVTMLQASK